MLTCHVTIMSVVNTSANNIECDAKMDRWTILCDDFKIQRLYLYMVSGHLSRIKLSSKHIFRDQNAILLYSILV